MSKQPLFILLAKPTTTVQIDRMFERGAVQALLEQPGELRYAGWDLETRDRARIVRGEYLEVAAGDRKRIQLYEDGTLIVRIPADSEFLGWGRSEQEFAKRPRLNPLALIEVTYNFVDLYRRIIAHAKPTPPEHILRASLRNAAIEENKLYLNPYGVDTWAYELDDHRYPAPDESMDRDIPVPNNVLANEPARAAYLLVEKIYLWFGVPTNEIPYVIEANATKSLDVEKIKRGGK